MKILTKQYRNHFKCRCMIFYDQRITGMDVMSGTWKVHTSIIQLIYPQGLHRTVYRLLPDKMEEFLSEDDELFESCFEKVVYRKRRF